jgi:hypothetical protein
MKIKRDTHLHLHHQQFDPSKKPIILPIFIGLGKSKIYLKIN